MGTHRLGAIPRLVPVCVCPSQPGFEARVAELGAPATAVVQVSHLGDQERGDLAGENRVLAGVRGCRQRQSPPVPVASSLSRHRTRSCQYIFVELGTEALVWWEERGHLAPKEVHGVGGSESPPLALAGGSHTCCGMAAHGHTQAGMSPNTPGVGQCSENPQPALRWQIPTGTHTPLESEAGRGRQENPVSMALRMRSMCSGSDRPGSILGPSAYWLYDA